MIRVSKVGKVMYIHLRRHDTVAPLLVQVGSEEMSSDRQLRMQFRRALKMETICRKY